MLVWLGLLSFLQGRSVWSIPNLLASTFYGEVALRRGFRWTTLSGVALHLVMTAIVGLVFGLAVGGATNRSRVMLLGLAAADVEHRCRRLDRDESPARKPPGEVDHLRAGPRPGAEDSGIGPQLRKDAPDEQVESVPQRGHLRPLLVVTRGALQA